MPPIIPADPRTGTVLLPRNQGGQLDWFYRTVDPDNSWRIAAPYRLFRQFDMRAVHPRPDNETHAMEYHRVADTKTTYKCRFSWIGGEPGYRLTLLKKPAGMTFANGDVVQTYNRTQDVIVTTRYVHSMPEEWATVEWQPTTEQHGQTYNVWVMVESQQKLIGETYVDHYIIIKWTVEVNDGKIRYAAETGNNAANGSYETPWQTVEYALDLANSVNFVLKLMDGSYPIGKTITSAMCRSIIGVNDEAELDTSPGGINIQTNGMSLINLGINGSPETSGHFKPIRQSGRLDRRTYHKLRFSNIVPTSYGDNASCIFTAQLGEPASAVNEYLSLTDSGMDSTSKAQLLCTFSDRYVVAENVNCPAINIPVTPYGAKVMHFKAQTSDVSVRHCSAAGLSDNAFISFANQYAINCANQEMVFCNLDYAGNTLSAAVLWNQQATGTPDKGVNQFLERCTIKGGTRQPLAFFENGGGTGGQLVNASGVAWDGSSSTIWTSPNNKGLEVGAPNIKFSAGQIESDYRLADAVRAANLGLVGSEIASTLVV